MLNGAFKFLRRKKAVSRNERAEKFVRRLGLKGDVRRILLPRIGLLLLFVLAAITLFPPSKRTQDVMFKAGQIADRNIIAPFDFEVPLSDEDLTLARADASLNVLPVYVRDRSVERDLSRDLSAAFDSVATVLANKQLSDEEKARITGDLFPYLSANMIRTLLSPSRLTTVRTAAMEYQDWVFSRGFIDNAGPLRRRAYTNVSVVDGNQEMQQPVRDLIDQGRIDRLIKEEGFRRFSKNRALATVFFEIVRGHLLPNMIYDTEETEARRQAAMDQVPRTIRISQNQRIIGKHDKVTADQEEMLLALEVERASRETQRSPLIVTTLYTGEILRLLLYGILFGGFVAVFQRRVYEDLLRLVAVTVVLLIFLVFSAVVVRFSMSPYLMPVAFVSLMITALFGYRLGLVTTVFACFAVPLVTNLSPHVGFVSLLAGTTAVYGLLRMRSRSHFYSVFGLVAGAYVVGVTSIELGHVEKFSAIYGHVGWAVANALFSTLAAMFLLPIFESIFNMTTRFTLLELTDLNKPILKRLNMEAPGTYHHSMLLGSLVDAVAADVGADALKARVMAYYHDIGKIFKPEYFAENQEAGFNKHEKITPQMSALILLAHVKDGVELAREEKLPDIIIDAIQQHHGTTVMAFFYQKALETDSHSSVNKDDFRYPGPRPRSKEAAILMLADTVEPACRSLKDPTPAHVRNMVVKLINARAQDGELDYSGLTLNDLARIKEKFISILTGIYHKRVAYPGQDKEDEGERETVAKPVASK